MVRAYDTGPAPRTPPALTSTVVRGVGLAGAGHVLTRLLALATYLVLGRLATPHDFGQLAAGSLVVGVGLLVSESGMAAALVQRRDRIEEAASTALVATVLSGLLLGLIALALAPVVGLVFRSYEIGLVAAAMAGYVPLRQAVVVPDALMQRRFSFVRRFVLEPMGITAFGATAIATTAAGLGVWGLVVATYAGVVVQAILSWSLVRWHPAWRLVSFEMWRELARFGAHVFVAESIRIGHEGIRTALIGRVVGTAALGQFGYAFRVAIQPLSIIVNAPSYVLTPALSRISDDEERFRGAFLRSLRWMAVASFPASLILLPLGEALTVLVFGDQWRPAGRAVAAMCAFSAGSALVSLASEAWKASGQPQWLVKAQTLDAVVGVGLAAAMVPFGLTAVGFSLSASATITACYALWGVARVVRTPVSSLVREVWPALVASAVMALAVFGLEAVIHADRRAIAPGLALIAAEGLAGAAVYLVTLWAGSPATARDLLELVRQVRDRHRMGNATTGMAR